MTASQSAARKPDLSERFPAPVPNGHSEPAAAPFDLHPAIIRGLRRSTAAVLPDGRVVLEVLLDVPGGRPPELLQILMHPQGAADVAQDLRDAAAQATRGR